MLGDSSIGGAFTRFDGSGPAKLVQKPATGQAGVGQCLQGGEGLGGNNEQRRLGVEVFGLLCHIGGVDVGDETRLQPGFHIGLERLVHHHRTKIGSTDPDVHHRGDRFAGNADPFAASHFVSEGVHLGKHLVYLGDDIGAVDDQAGSLGRTQRGVQYRTVLGDVDMFPGEHGMPAIHQTHLVSKINKGAHDVGVDQVLGEVDVEIARCVGERFRPRRIGGEPTAQIRHQRFVEGLQPCPGRGRRRVYRLAHGVPLVAPHSWSCSRNADACSGGIQVTLLSQARSPQSPAHTEEGPRTGSVACRPWIPG